METINVFYSTTEEEVLQKYRGHFEARCKQVGRLLDVHFNLLYWRELAGGLGDSAQDVIDKQVEGNHQIYFGVMATRFGKGTEHEYRRAVEEHIASHKPAFVSFGFCEEKVNPYAIDLESMAKLKQFRSDVGDNKKYGKANLYFVFSNKAVFDERVDANLKAAVMQIRSRVAGGARVKI